jgi:hypothetical protein
LAWNDLVSLMLVLAISHCLTPVESNFFFPTNKPTNGGVPRGIPRLGHVAPCYLPIKMPCVQIPFIHLSYLVSATVPSTLANCHVSYDCMDLATSSRAMCHPCNGATCHNMTFPPLHLPMLARIHVNFPTHYHIIV